MAAEEAADIARFEEYERDVENAIAIGDFGLGPISKWKKIPWTPAEDYDYEEEEEEEEEEGWNTDEWAYRCLKNHCSHGENQRCAKRILTEGWHESIDENRLMTREEYCTLSPIIASKFIERWVNMQPDKEAALDKAAEFLAQMENADKY